MINLIKPGETIGIVGGGQLGQMMALSAKEMGFKVGVLDPVSDCPAAQVADWSIVADYEDTSALKELNKCVSVVTYEFENINAEALKNSVPLHKLPQGIKLLEISQHRKHEKEFLSEIGVPIAPFFIVTNTDELLEGLNQLSYPAVLKTCQGGYDGKGQIVLKSEEDVTEAISLLTNQVCVLESWISFDMEISVIVSGNAQGDYQVFPIPENIHKNNVLFQSIAPSRKNKEINGEAEKLALKIAKELSIQGVVTIEMFVTKEGEILVNEIAPRPHNSGHFSIEACNISQFDAHIRGICNWGLPKIYLQQPVIMLNLLGEEMLRSQDYLQEKSDWAFHYYGKSEVKEGRKMGHITILTSDIDKTLQEVEATKIWE
ncbi:MAG: 5-(carboxyamino)imidazole ribonucleotide synthase [Vagococcus sp.]|uniref:5-(carboxyamino)imidazole ribonucleotide synthase n=1 Tax=Vagococcus TaxID=2737 RepID=UPI002FC58982